ncbi:High mobility group protein B2 [Tupaia chinensis]|uniref:High mobility group protein B2 n=1 Tax=Tupaia chinensis TaxID=246437 RepID=L9L4Q2_TUPCH|nr:High mobility group protein B2 [Tupaia chinensis]
MLMKPRCLSRNGKLHYQKTSEYEKDIAAYRAKGKSEAGKQGPGRPTGSKKKNEPEDEEEDEEEEEEEDEEEEDEDEE